MAFGRNSTPNVTRTRAIACAGSRSGAERPTAAKASTAAVSQTTPNRMSRQIRPTKKKEGGASATSGVRRPSHGFCRTAIRASRPKASQ